MYLLTQLQYILFSSNLIVWCVLHARIFFHYPFFFNIWCNAQKSWPTHREHALRGQRKIQHYYLSQILLGLDSDFVHDITCGGYNTHIINEMVRLWLLINTLPGNQFSLFYNFCIVLSWPAFSKELLWEYGQNTGLWIDVLQCSGLINFLESVSLVC